MFDVLMNQSAIIHRHPTYDWGLFYTFIIGNIFLINIWIGVCYDLLRWTVSMFRKKLSLVTVCHLLGKNLLNVWCIYETALKLASLSYSDVYMSMTRDETNISNLHWGWFCSLFELCFKKGVLLRARLKDRLFHHLQDIDISDPCRQIRSLLSTGSQWT